VGFGIERKACFLKKGSKRPSKLVDALAGPRTPSRQSFLVLLFKKELLPLPTRRVSGRHSPANGRAAVFY
jgi:hypothetical protein